MFRSTRVPSAIWRRAYSTSSTPVFVLQTYDLIPKHARLFRDLTTAVAAPPKRLFPNMLFSGVPTIGGTLDVAYHLHHFKNHGALAPMEGEIAAGVNYDDYIKMASSILEDVAQAPEQPNWHLDVLKCISRKESTVFLEAKTTLDSVELPGAMAFESPQPASKSTVYEFRRYHLKLGYDTVPNFLKFYGDGLPSKLKADQRAQLVTLLYSDIGRLNVVIEIWRHDSLNAMMGSRIASREAKEWRTAISSIANLAQSFQNIIIHPQPESRWQ